MEIFTLFWPKKGMDIYILEGMWYDWMSLPLNTLLYGCVINNAMHFCITQQSSSDKLSVGYVCSLKHWHRSNHPHMPGMEMKRSGKNFKLTWKIMRSAFLYGSAFNNVRFGWLKNFQGWLETFCASAVQQTFRTDVEV